MQTYVVADASPCVDDEALFALARGELGGAELARAEAHLQDCADCRAVLAAATEPGEARAPARIARYEIAALLGAGAAGVVYRAFDPQLRRPVALKLLGPERHASPDQSERLLREAQAMARLSDPHVVAVYDVGLHEGAVYLVMEYIDGPTLSEWLRAEKRSTAEILRVFGDAARGLWAAHQKGLVHRDFKPENVLVTRDGRAKVTDFGLARENESWLLLRLPDDVAAAEPYAPTRGLVGTPAYMAPELFEGERATPQSDQFAFAVSLFVALFERHPFKAGEGITLSELVTRVRAGTVQTPVFAGARAEHSFAVLRRALSATPDARFADLPALLAALGAPRGARGGGFWAVALLAPLLVSVAIWRVLHAPVPVAAVANQTRPEPSASTPPAPSVALAATPTPLPATEPPPGEPSARRARPAASADKRRPPKQSDVRYKDWLKDPF
jgi:eukaryotic-like serine/threonine-protein kinase